MTDTTATETTSISATIPLVPDAQYLLTSLRSHFAEKRELDKARSKHPYMIKLDEGKTMHQLNSQIGFCFNELKTIGQEDIFKIEWRRDQLIRNGFDPKDHPLNPYENVFFRLNEFGAVVVAT